MSAGDDVDVANVTEPVFPTVSSCAVKLLLLAAGTDSEVGLLWEIEAPVRHGKDCPLVPFCPLLCPTTFAPVVELANDSFMSAVDAEAVPVVMGESRINVPNKGSAAKPHFTDDRAFTPGTSLHIPEP